MTDITNTSQDLLSIYWPNRTPAKERTEIEDEAIQSWLAAYNNDWAEEDVVLSAFIYEECPEPDTYSGSGTEAGKFASILITADTDDGYGGSSATMTQFVDDYDWVEFGEETVLAMMSEQEEVVLSAQVGTDAIIGFLTFRDLPFGSKVRVNKAIIKVKAYDSSSNTQGNTVLASIRAHCSATTNPPTNKAQLLGNTRTWRGTEWNVNSNWTADSVYDTPDMAWVIEEVARLSGWDSGITFFIDTDKDASDQVRKFYSLEGGYPAELQVWYNDTYDETPTGGVIVGGRKANVSGGAQELNPNSDIDTGTWIVAPLYPKIDESFPDDTDFISSANNPSNSTCEVKLETGLDPQVSTGHVVYYRCKKSDQDYTMGLTVRLMQGASMIAEWTHNNVPFEWTEFEQTLSTVQANSITDYSDLSVKLIANMV
jgi:hypothetical protein